MPKKKTGARKKAEKQKQRQKDIKSASESRNIVQQPCNTQMVGITSSSGCFLMNSSLHVVHGCIQECDKCKRFVLLDRIDYTRYMAMWINSSHVLLSDDRRIEHFATSASRCKSCPAVRSVVSKGHVTMDRLSHTPQ